MSIILPTHTCFDDAINFVVEANIDPSKWHEYTIVHGICLTPRPTKMRYAHAWIERGANVIQVMVDGDTLERFAVQLARVEFQQHYRVQHETRYTIEEAALENLRTGHLGPWVAKYRKMQARAIKRQGGVLRTWVGPSLELIETREANEKDQT